MPERRTRSQRREWPFWRYLAYVGGPVVTTGGRPIRARPLKRRKA